MMVQRNEKMVDVSGNTTNSSKYRDSALFTLSAKKSGLDERTSTTEEVVRDSAYAPVKRLL